MRTFKPILAFFAKPTTALWGAIALAFVAISLAWAGGRATLSGQYVRAVMAPLTAVGGESADLSFQIPGQVASLPVAIGERVAKGTLLVALDQSALQASRSGAQANKEAAEARLAALIAGTRPEQLAITQTTLDQAKVSLRDTVRSAYLTADDAVHTKADQLFINPRSSLPALIFTPSDQALQNAVLAERSALEAVLLEWGSQVTAKDFATSDPLIDAGQAQTLLTQVARFLDDTARLLGESAPSGSLVPATVQAYEASINAARLGLSGSMSAVTGGTTAVKSAEGVLALAQAGPTANDVAMARAAVDSATAVLAGIDVTLRESALVAPFAGTITTLNAHLGQTIASGQLLVSIESAGGSKERALVVPTSAIIQDGGSAFVYKQNGSTAPLKTLVTTGLVSADGMTEITSGLREGDEILTFGAPK